MVSVWGINLYDIKVFALGPRWFKIFSCLLYSSSDLISWVNLIKADRVYVMSSPIPIYVSHHVSEYWTKASLSYKSPWVFLSLEFTKVSCYKTWVHEQQVFWQLLNLLSEPTSVWMSTLVLKIWLQWSCRLETSQSVIHLKMSLKRFKQYTIMCRIYLCYFWSTLVPCFLTSVWFSSHTFIASTPRLLLCASVCLQKSIDLQC